MASIDTISMEGEENHVSDVWETLNLRYESVTHLGFPNVQTMHLSFLLKLSFVVSRTCDQKNSGR